MSLLSSQNRTIEQQKAQIWWWGVLGPAMLVGSLLILFVREGPLPVAVPVLIIAGMLLSARFGLVGLLCSLIFLIVGLGFELRGFPAHEKVWYLGFAAAVGIAYLLIVLTREEVEQATLPASVERVQETRTELDPTAYKKELEEARAVALGLEQRLQELAELPSQLESVRQDVLDKQIELDSTRTMLKRVEADRDAWAMEVREARAAVLDLEQKLKEYAWFPSQLDALRQDLLDKESDLEATRALLTQAQVEADHTLCVRHLDEAQEKAADLEQRLKGYEGLSSKLEILRQDLQDKERQLQAKHSLLTQMRHEMEEVREECERQVQESRHELTLEKERHAHLIQQTESAGVRIQQTVDRYQQLRTQFEQKGEQLHQTRVNVWQVETKLESLLREQAELAVQRNPMEEQLLGEIDHLTATCTAKEREISTLEELVSQLLDELKKRCVPGLSALRIPRA